MIGILQLIADYRLGRALRGAFAAKHRGADFLLCSSWCSDRVVVVARVRRAGESGVGEPRVGELDDVVRWAARAAEAKP